jgi:hypothetical protein
VGRKVLLSGDVIWMHWPPDAELQWLLQGSPSWSSAITWERECVNWPLEERDFWGWRLVDPLDGTRSMLCYDDLEFVLHVENQLQLEESDAPEADPWHVVSQRAAHGMGLVALRDGAALFYSPSGRFQLTAPNGQAIELDGEMYSDIQALPSLAELSARLATSREPSPSSKIWDLFAQVNLCLVALLRVNSCLHQHRDDASLQELRRSIIFSKPCRPLSRRESLKRKAAKVAANQAAAK